MPIVPEQTGLWQRSLGVHQDEHEPLRERLRTSLKSFRERVAVLSAQIAKALPQLTVHDVTHLDALWGLADLIAGPEYPITPLEAFTFGGAVLLHDAALCFEAYEGGVEAVRSTPEWKDAYAAGIDSENDTRAENADFIALRALHAKQAAELADKNWIDQSTGEGIYLIDDYDLRKRYGNLIGSIAASHHLNVSELLDMQPQVNAPSAYPADWRVDPVKVACLLRCADAAHLNDQRAPDFVLALLRRHGVSADHWKAQNWLSGPDLDQSDPSGETLVYTSSRDFAETDADAWWVAFDGLTIVDAELRSCRDLLVSRPQYSATPEFRAKRVRGTSSPEEMGRYVRANGWQPYSASVHVSDVESLVRTLGGSGLYGEKEGIQRLTIAFRELVQNSRDAIVARQILEPGTTGKIVVSLEKEEANSDWVFRVEDDGVGMSDRVMLESLLDFGRSFWSGGLVATEFPGLRSSGFKSIGKYGIGFFSVFSVAKAVFVTSRRFDRGLDASKTLSFPKGLSLRPLVSAKSEVSYTTRCSTVVRLVLEENLVPEDGRLVIRSNIREQPDFVSTFADFVASLCAGLDVPVEVRAFGQTKVVHRAILEVVANKELRKEWLKDVSLSNSEHSNVSNADLDTYADLLEPIFGDQGEVLALAALGHTQSSMGSAQIDTVGGLRPGFPALGSRSPKFVGYFDRRPNSAKREVGERIATGVQMQAWVSTQVERLASLNIDPIAWCLVTQNVAALEVDPSDVFRVLGVGPNGAEVVDLETLYGRVEVGQVAIFISRNVELIDSWVDITQYKSFFTLRPITTGNFLSLRFDGNNPSEPNSLFGCLFRKAASRGKRLRIQRTLDVHRTMLGPVDAGVFVLEDNGPSVGPEA